MQASPLPLSFFDTYSLSTSSQECNALCMIINFLVLWSTCFSSSLIHFRKGLEYLMRGTAQVFIPLIWFLQDSFVSSSFLVLLGYSFLILSFISTCLMVSASKIPKYYYNYYLLTLLEFFTSALADCLSLEFGWQQVPSSLQDSSQYSGLSQ